MIRRASVDVWWAGHDAHPLDLLALRGGDRLRLVDDDVLPHDLPGFSCRSRHVAHVVNFKQVMVDQSLDGIEHPQSISI